MEENRNEMNMDVAANEEIVTGEVMEDYEGGLGAVVGTIALCAAGYVVGRVAVGGGKKLFGWGKKKIESAKTKAEAKKFVDAQKVQAEVVEPEKNETK